MKKVIAIYMMWISCVEALSIVPFEASMSACYEYQTEIAQQNKDWQFLKSIYEHYQYDFHLDNEYKIPKRIHLIWLGSPLPERYADIINSWKQFHPDWIVKVWTDADALEFNLFNQTAFDQAKNYGEKSDIFRYEILYRHGGLYVDTDFECLQPFDEIHRSCEFYSGIGQSPVPQIWIGIIGSIPEHPILKATIENLKIGPGDFDLERIMRDTGTYHFTKMFFDLASTCPIGTVVAFPVTIFYPFPGCKRDLKDKLKIKAEFAAQESMAIHYFDTSWQNP